MKKLLTLLPTLLLLGCDPPPEAWEGRIPGGDPQFGLFIALLIVVVAYRARRLSRA
jgi:hypothetical protein